MVTSTLLLSGQLIVDGVRFLWWVIDGKPAKLTVSHPIHGTHTGVPEGNVEDVAREFARQLLGSGGAQEGEPPVVHFSSSSRRST